MGFLVLTISVTWLSVIFVFTVFGQTWPAEQRFISKLEKKNAATFSLRLITAPCDCYGWEMWMLFIVWTLQLSVTSYFPNASTSWLSFSDEDECQVRNGGCHQLCLNTDGGHVCACQKGYYLTGNKVSCAGMSNTNAIICKLSIRWMYTFIKLFMSVSFGPVFVWVFFNAPEDTFYFETIYEKLIIKRFETGWHDGNAG